MVALPTQDQSGDVTATVPTDRVSARSYALKGSYLSQGLDRLSDGLNDLNVPLSQQAAAQALDNTTVTRDAQGNVTVGAAPNLPILGPGGMAYDHAVAAGMMAQGDNATSQAITQLRAQHEGDPAGFQKAYTSYAANLTANNPGPLGVSMAEHANALGTQHYDGMVQTQAIQGVQAAKTSIDQAMQSKLDTLSSLAQGGGTDTAEFGTAAAEYNSLSKQLTSNPAFAVPKSVQDQVDSAAFNQLHGYAIAGKVDQDMKGPGGIIQAKQNLHDAIMDPNSGLSPAQQAHFMSVGEARIQFNTGQNEAAVQANRQNIAALDQAVKNPSSSTKLSEPIWQAAILNAQSVGDSVSTKQLAAMHQQWQYQNDTRTLAPNQSLNQQGLGNGPQPGTPSVSGAPVSTPQGLQAYKARVGQIESASGSNEGAMGSFYQFTPGTWAKYAGTGGSKGTAAGEDAPMNALTADNHAALSAGLGREPTQAELYLAHQQGAQGAMKLMDQPSRRAGDIVGDAAINGNGGNSSMTAGDFTAMWQAKFNKTPLPSANGIPYTPDQLKANPFLLSSAVRGITSDPENRYSYGQKLGESILATTKNGFVPPTDVAANYMQIAGDEPRLAEQSSHIQAAVTGMAMADQAMGGRGQPMGGAINLSPGQGQAYIDNVQAQARGGSLYQQEVAAQAKDFYQKGVEGLKKDPFGTAVAKGWDGGKGAPDPLNFTDPTALAVGLHQRSDLASSIAARTGDQNIGALAPAEVDGVKAQLEGPNAMNVASAISTLPPARMNATLAQLGEKGTGGQVLAIAGSLYKDAPDVAQDITQGWLAMKEKGDYAPKPLDANTEMDKYMPNATFGVAAREGVMNAVTAVYAKASADARDTSGVINSSRFQDAVDRVTGGVLSYHGGQLIAPTRGMSQGDFDNVVGHVGDDDLKGATTLGGQPVTGDVFQNSAKLENAGDGKYFVRLDNNAAKPVYAYSQGQNGQPTKFVLNLAGRAPTPGGGPNALPTNFGTP